MEQESQYSIPTIDIDENNVSFFSETYFPNAYRGELLLSEQIGAKNFRIRESKPPYKTGFHVAGEATMLLVQSGCLRIELHDGSFQDFISGDAFIAKDYMKVENEFDPCIHGHRAEIIGTETLRVIHIKLDESEK